MWKFLYIKNPNWEYEAISANILCYREQAYIFNLQQWSRPNTIIYYIDEIDCYF